jgi:hypothetical protein
LIVIDVSTRRWGRRRRHNESKLRVTGRPAVQGGDEGRSMSRWAVMQDGGPASGRQ